MNTSEKVFEQLVDTLTRKEGCLPESTDDGSVAYSTDHSDDYWVASDCIPIDDEGWDSSMY